LSHIVSVPNHPRIWRKEVLLKIGNYSEFLPISDDYELVVRTAVKTKMARVHKLAYIQYMNNSSNNFSLIRNSEINRLCRCHLSPHCYREYKVVEKMKELGAYDNEEYLYGNSRFSQIWKRENYEFNYCNDVYNFDFDKQYCIIGIDTLKENLQEIMELYKDNDKDKRYDFLVLENTINTEALTRELDYLQLDRMRCYAMSDSTNEQLEKYFHLIYRSCEDYFVYKKF
jgi:hypothetical protein